MKRALLFVVPLVLLFGSTTIAQTVRFNVDRGADFSTFKTYTWQVSGGSAVDELQDQQIRAGIDAQLALKGLIEVPEGPADLFVTSRTTIAIEKAISVYSTVRDGRYGPGWGWSYGISGWYGGPTGWWTVGETATILVREIAVDINSTRGGLVWRGVISTALDDDAKPEKQHKRLYKSLRKLFEHYPPTFDS